jgi:hypothetical protein
MLCLFKSFISLECVATRLALNPKSLCLNTCHIYDSVWLHHCILNTCWYMLFQFMLPFEAVWCALCLQIIKYKHINEIVYAELYEQTILWAIIQKDAVNINIHSINCTIHSWPFIKMNILSWHIWNRCEVVDLAPTVGVLLSITVDEQTRNT